MDVSKREPDIVMIVQACRSTSFSRTTSLTTTHSAVHLVHRPTRLIGSRHIRIISSQDIINDAAKKVYTVPNLSTDPDQSLGHTVIL